MRVVQARRPAFPPRFKKRDASFFDLYALWASAVSEPRRFFVACEDCAVRLALSLPRRLDNRVSSSSALSEARRIFLRYLSHARVYGCCNFMRVLSLNWNYGMCSARYIPTSLPASSPLASLRNSLRNYTLITLRVIARSRAISRISRSSRARVILARNSVITRPLARSTRIHANICTRVIPALIPQYSVRTAKTYSNCAHSFGLDTHAK